MRLSPSTLSGATGNAVASNESVMLRTMPLETADERR